MADNESDVSDTEINDFRIRELHQLAAKNAKDIHHIQMVLHQIIDNDLDGEIDHSDDIEALYDRLEEDTPSAKKERYTSW